MDTVAKENENNEVDTEDHAVSLDSALRPDGVKHYFVPVFAGQYLTQFTRHLLSTSSAAAAASASSLQSSSLASVLYLLQNEVHVNSFISKQI